MFTKVLIANRGAIAVRIIRTLRDMGVGSVAVYSEADANSRHVSLADEAWSLGEGAAAQTYLDTEKLFAVAQQTGAQAIHPGYGFLSENAAFAERCEAQGLVFLGPRPEQMRAFGLKHSARALAEANYVPLLPGTGLLADPAEAVAAAASIGYPVMLKSTAGGGGIGMSLCYSEAELQQAWASVKRLSENNFANGGLFLEKFVEQARHIEVQVFGDGSGHAVALGERDCSAQRRNQKVVEETPAPNLPEAIRQELHRVARTLLAAVQYRSAGTVEFVVDQQTSAFYFLEVNTRLQVEHGVTEQVYGVDLVRWMIELGAGELADLDARFALLKPAGHAIQVRLYAEDTQKDFRPSAGLLSEVSFPPADGVQCRIDHWISKGIEVSPWFDPMLAKVIVRGDTREEAIMRLRAVLAETVLYGIETNRAYVAAILDGKVFRNGLMTTRYLNGFAVSLPTVDVLSGGTLTTVQDCPGRKGYWHVGVPPSGPFDRLSFQTGNQLLGNASECAGLEITLNGPTLQFNVATRIVVAGAPFVLRLDGQNASMNTVLSVAAGQQLSIGKALGGGARCYLLIQGGLDCPRYLGSRSTFTLGQFGGHNGRALRAGDVLHLMDASLDAPLDDAENKSVNTPVSTTISTATSAATSIVLKTAPGSMASGVEAFTTTEFMASAPTRLAGSTPARSDKKIWPLRVIYGPHGAPDFFTDEDIATFFAQAWEVHYNSSRTGIRLIGPKPQWARRDGGDAGMHPSNIHDNAYAFGTVDFTGDMPVILGPDGPSLGGFVCPATVIAADLWKLGQLQAGDLVRFIAVSQLHANQCERAQREAIKRIQVNGADGLDKAAFLAINAETDFDTGAGFNSAADLDAGADAGADFNTSEKVKALPLISPVLRTLPADEGKPQLVVRAAGDHFLLLEYGPLALDIELRFRVHLLMQNLQANPIAGIEELTPGIRSLQVHYDPLQVPLQKLLDLLMERDEGLGDCEQAAVPARVVHLPLSWDDEACQLAISKYMQSVRRDAPWCPSNLEFIRRINGLDSIDDVRRIVFDASYLVMGLGDVYLGAPVATPLDPRHRLVTTKYNPARTWTAENSVGIGGAYLCVYGMEGPGGYQFVGRTLQMWNRYKQTAEFEQPWLLRFFDQIRFYEVSAEELQRIRLDFPEGRYPLRIEPVQFSLQGYRTFLRDHQAETDSLVAQRQLAFNAELQRWIDSGQINFESESPIHEMAETAMLEDGCTALESHVAGSIWQVLVQPGDAVAAGQTVMVLESMKMEIDIATTVAGVVERVSRESGQSVRAGQTLMVIREV